jgi:hypothetical protein
LGELQKRLLLKVNLQRSSFRHHLYNSVKWERSTTRKWVMSNNNLSTSAQHLFNNLKLINIYSFISKTHFLKVQKEIIIILFNNEKLYATDGKKKFNWFKSK